MWSDSTLQRICPLHLVFSWSVKMRRVLKEGEIGVQKYCHSSVRRAEGGTLTTFGESGNGKIQSVDWKSSRSVSILLSPS